MNNKDEKSVVKIEEPKVTQSEVVKPNAMTIRDTEKTSLLNPEIYVQMKVLANDFINSKAIPQCWQTASQVLVGLQTGLEMGMTPMESMNSLYVVNGAVNIWGKAVTKRLRVHGYKVAYVDESPEQTTAIISKGNETYSFTFKLADAEASGYTKDQYGKYKVGWKPGQNRLLKLRYGALSALLKTEVPEVLGPVNGVTEIENDFSELPKGLPGGEDKVKQIAEAVKNDSQD
jgi:hypothetical protein